MQPTEQSQTLKQRSQYSQKWQDRFAFFDAHGAPSAPGYKPALMPLPFKEKLKINANVIAFFFGPIYLFVLGLWKKNLTIIGIMIAVNIVLDLILAMIGIDSPKALDIGVTVAFNMFYALSTNYAYYLKEVKGEQDWSPFKGMRW